MGSFVKITSLTLVFIVCFSQITYAKLILLNVIFRHGDRSPERGETYPNDPYINQTYFPLGYGALTNEGKLREYRLGQHLRYNYGNFLGDTYIPDEIRARSTGIDRAKVSLYLVLAGMYPPAYHQQWNPVLDWLPIPTEYVPALDDVLMLPQQCPKYLKAREQAEETPEVKTELSKYDWLLKKLTKVTGNNVTSEVDVFAIYQLLMAQSSLNLELPIWTRGIFPYGPLHDAAVLEYEVASYTEEMKRLNGGMFLRKITEDMNDARQGKLNPPRKVLLYGGHEANIAAVLQSLGIYSPHVPRYSSAIFLELHKDERSENYFVRVRYYRGYTIRYGEILDEVMQIPGCAKFCDLRKFEDVLKNVIATDEDIRACDKRSLKDYLESGNSNLSPILTGGILADIRKEEIQRYVLH